jgi:hypothetical protein
MSSDLKIDLLYPIGYNKWTFKFEEEDDEAGPFAADNDRKMRIKRLVQ